MLKVEELRKEVCINEIQEEISEYNDGYICDVISSIADNNVDIYYYDLFKWLPNNYEYVEQAIDEFGAPKEFDIPKVIQMGQFYKNEQDLYEDLDAMMLYFCYSYILCDLKKDEITEEQQEKIENKCTNVDNNDRLDSYVDFLDELFNESEEQDG